jgi:hypothetical protein
MGLFNKAVPDEALFGATAMVWAMSIDVIYNGGTTEELERIGQMSSLRRALVGMTGVYPGCRRAVATLDANFPVIPSDPVLASLATDRGGDAQLTDTDFDLLDVARRQIMAGFGWGKTGPAAATFGDELVQRLLTEAGLDAKAERASHCGLVVGLSIDKVLYDSRTVAKTERQKRQGYAADIGARWLVIHFTQ